MRAIIRVSINGENNGALRNALAGILTGSGFALTNATATYEHAGISIAELSEVMRRFWVTAADPTGVPAIQEGAHLDHAWFYVD